VYIVSVEISFPFFPPFFDVYHEFKLVIPEFSSPVKGAIAGSFHILLTARSCIGAVPPRVKPPSSRLIIPRTSGTASRLLIRRSRGSSGEIRRRRLSANSPRTLIRAAPIQSRDILAAIDGVAAQTDARARRTGASFSRAQRADASGRSRGFAIRIYAAQ